VFRNACCGRLYHRPTGHLETGEVSFQELGNRSIEIVLHTSFNNQVPSAPDVVATYCW